MRKLILLVLLGMCAPVHAGEVTFHGVQEYRLFDTIGIVDPFGEVFELHTSVSYFDFYVAAPGAVEFNISASSDFPTFHQNGSYDHLPYLTVVYCCDHDGAARFRSWGEFETEGALSSGGHQVMVYVGGSGYMFDYGDPWRIVNGLADLSQDYSPVPYALQISGEHVFKNYGQYVASTVPEPGALTLLLAGLVGLRRRFIRQ